MSEKQSPWRLLLRVTLAALGCGAGALVSGIALHAPADAYPLWPQWVDYHTALLIYWWMCAIFGVGYAGIVIAYLVTLVIAGAALARARGETL